MKKTKREENRDLLLCKNELLKDLLATESKLPDFWERATQGAYTNHGRPHIEMVEHYVGELLGKERLNKLYPEEFFILVLGVFCHDLGMMRFRSEGKDKIKIERDLHNVWSYQFIYENGTPTELAKKNIIVPENKYYKPIALLCLGHRDHNDEKGDTVHTLKDTCEINGKKVKIEEKITIGSIDVHLRYLAAILRLADELDLDNTRAPEDLKMYFKDFIPEASYDHWVKHQLIHHVSFENDGSKTNITLVPDYEKIRSLSDGTEDKIARELLLRMIFSARKKIEEEIEDINAITFNHDMVDDGLAVEFDIDIAYDNDVISKDDYARYQTNVDKQFTEEENDQLEDDFFDEENDGIVSSKRKKPIDVFNEELQKFKRDRNLLETGSFKFSFEKGKNEYTQYFINTQLLLTNRRALNAITDIFKDRYSKENIDCVIGIGKSGIALAPNLSLKLNCNSSYLICDWEDTASVEWEKRVSVIDTAKNVLVLLDVISTGTATRQGIEKIKKKNSTTLENIYIGAVFCTDITIKEKIKKEDKIKDLFSINDDFQFRTYIYTPDEYIKDEKFRKEFELLPLRKK